MDILSPALSLEETYYASGLALGQSDGTQQGLVEGRFFGLEKGFEKFAAMSRLHGRAVIWGSRLGVGEGRDGGNDEEGGEKRGGEEQEEGRGFMPALFGGSSTGAYEREDGMEGEGPGSAGAGAAETSIPTDTNAQPQLRHAATSTLASHLPTSESSLASILPPPPQSKPHPPLQPLPSPQPRLKKHIQTLYALSEPESLDTRNTEDAVADFDDRYKRAQGRARIIARAVGESLDDSVGVGKGKGGAGRGGGGLEKGVDGEGREGEGEGEVEEVAARAARVRVGQGSGGALGGRANGGGGWAKGESGTAAEGREDVETEVQMQMEWEVR